MAPATTTMKPGETIGKYRLVSRLGHGGMGEVWLALANGYGGFSKQVVLKTLLPEYEEDPQYIDMLAHEARTCGKLHHPNLIEVFDFSRHGRVHLLAMEHVDGASLAHILRALGTRGWQVPPWFALRVAWECARGLECAHDCGVIHCDLSPSNIMVTYAGVTKIVDFGVAHSPAHGERPDRLKGKFSYMAPERFRDLAADQRTDIYALGVMLYLLFGGRLPFHADSDAELIRQKQARPLPPSEHAPIDPAIERLIMRALEPDPDGRFQNAGELLAALTRCLTGQHGTYGQLDAAAFVSMLFDKSPVGALPAIPPPPPAPSPRPAPRYAPTAPIGPGRDPDTRAITMEAPIVGPPPPEPEDADVIEVDIELGDLAPEPDVAIDAAPQRELAVEHTRIQSMFGAVPGERRRRVTTPGRGWAWPWPTSRRKSE